MMNRRELIFGTAAAAVSVLFWPFGVGDLLFAAQPSADLPVTVTKTDGTLVRGKITAYDKDKITLDVIGKPKELPVSTDIPWDEIKRISNGLKRETGLQKWKLEHKDSLCVTCHGDAKVFCPTCHGTAHAPAASAGCPTCKGEAQIDCTTKKCVKGIIPCSNPKCLKLSDGGWVKHPDGERWKKFTNPDRSYTEWSEHHIGQIVDKVDGTWQNLGTCPVCMGATTIADPVCRGTSKMPCPTCSKKTQSPPCPNKCDAGLVQCPTCQGSGLKT